MFGKRGSMVLVFSILFGMNLSSQAQEKKIAILDLENSAQLTTSEIQVLTAKIRDSFRGLPADQYTVGEFQDSSTEQIECDEKCMVGKVGQLGADYVVAGAVSFFGESYVISIRLYDSQWSNIIGSVNTAAAPAVEELLDLVGTVCGVLRGELPVRKSVKPPPAHGARTFAEHRESNSVSYSSGTGILRVSSTPKGARVYVGGFRRGKGGDFAGTTPLSKQLLPRRYWVRIRLNNYKSHKGWTTVFVGQTTNYMAELEPDFPASPYKIWGHISFWPGLVLGVTGIANGATGGSVELTVSGLALGGALLTTGVVLWIIAPDDKQYYRSKHKKGLLTVAPTGHRNGALLAYHRTF